MEQQGKMRLSFFMVFAGFLMLGGFLSFRELDYSIANSFTATHWLFTMQDGLRSRALPATLLRLVFPDTYGTETVRYGAALWVHAVLLFSMAATAGAYWKCHQEPASLLVGAMFMASPGSIAFFALDLGRFDHIGYLLVMGTLWLMYALPDRWHWWLAGTVSIVLVLIHEVLVVLLAPLLFAVIWGCRMERIGSRQDLVRLMGKSVLAALPALVLAALLITVLRFDGPPVHLEMLINTLQEKADFPVNEVAALIHFRSVSDNVLLTLEYALQPRQLAMIFLAALALAPAGIMGYRLLSENLPAGKGSWSNPSQRIVGMTVCGACFAPLLLFLIGFDYPRWMAAVVNHFFLAGMMIGLINNKEQQVSDLSFSDLENKDYLIKGCVVLIYSMAVGPVTPVGPPEALIWPIRLLMRIMGI